MHLPYCGRYSSNSPQDGQTPADLAHTTTSRATHLGRVSQQNEYQCWGCLLVFRISLITLDSQSNIKYVCESSHTGGSLPVILWHAKKGRSYCVCQEQEGGKALVIKAKPISAHLLSKWCGSHWLIGLTPLATANTTLIVNEPFRQSILQWTLSRQ